MQTTAVVPVTMDTPGTSHKPSQSLPPAVGLDGEATLHVISPAS